MSGVHASLHQYMVQEHTRVRFVFRWLQNHFLKRYFSYNQEVFGTYLFSTEQRWELLKKIGHRVSQHMHYLGDSGFRYQFNQSRVPLWLLVRRLFTYKTFSKISAEKKSSCLQLKNTLSWLIFFMLHVFKSIGSNAALLKKQRVYRSVSNFEVKNEFLDIAENYKSSVHRELGYSDVFQDLLFKSGLFFRYRWNASQSRKLFSRTSPKLFNEAISHIVKSSSLCQSKAKMRQLSSFEILSSSFFARSLNSEVFSFLKNRAYLDYLFILSSSKAHLNLDTALLFSLVLFQLWNVVKHPAWSSSQKQHALWRLLTWFTLKTRSVAIGGSLSFLKWLGWILCSDSHMESCFSSIDSLFGFLDSLFAKLFIFSGCFKPSLKQPVRYSLIKSSLQISSQKLTTLFSKSEDLGSQFISSSVVYTEVGFFFIHIRSELLGTCRVRPVITLSLWNWHTTGLTWAHPLVTLFNKECYKKFF